MASQGGTPVHWLSMCISVADELPDRLNPTEDESSEQDAVAQEIGKLAAANWGVQSSSQCQTDHIEKESGW